MPRPPEGVGPGFWERLKTRVVEEMGGGRPGAPGVQSAEPPDESGTIAPTLYEKLKQRLKTLVPGAPKAPREPPPGLERILFRIRQAGRQRTLLLMKYHGVYRNVEPYSFRYRGKNRALRVFGFCRLHSTIEMYIPEKIQDAIVTDEPYSPRWEVELS